MEYWEKIVADLGGDHLIILGLLLLLGGKGLQNLVVRLFCVYRGKPYTNGSISEQKVREIVRSEVAPINRKIEDVRDELKKDLKAHDLQNETDLRQVRNEINAMNQNLINLASKN